MCYACATGHEFELHHPLGRATHPDYIVRISANDHRLLSDVDHGADAQLIAVLEAERLALLARLRG